MAADDKFDRLKRFVAAGSEKAFALDEDVEEPVVVRGRDIVEEFLADADQAEMELFEEAIPGEPVEVGEDLADLDSVLEVSDKTTDPVRMYLREMGTVPLLNRDGEIDLAKRIERGQRSVMKALARSPLVIRAVIHLAPALANGSKDIRDLLMLPDPPLADEVIEEERRRMESTIREMEKYYKKAQQYQQKLLAISRSMKPKQHRSLRWDWGRTLVRISRLIRAIRFTSDYRHDLAKTVHQAVEQAKPLEREIARSVSGLGEGPRAHHPGHDGRASPVRFLRPSAPRNFRQDNVGRLRPTEGHRLVGHHRHGVLVGKGVRVGLEARRVAAGDRHADAMTFVEDHARGPEVDVIGIPLSRDDR